VFRSPLLYPTELRARKKGARLFTRALNVVIFTKNDKDFFSKDDKSFK
jgi:hypothetical protein